MTGTDRHERTELCARGNPWPLRPRTGLHVPYTRSTKSRPLERTGRVTSSQPPSPLDEWNRQIDVVRTLVISAAKGYRNGLGLCGPPGVGKSYIVQKTLRDEEMEWAEVPRGLTPQGLLEFFEEHGDGIMIFDDVAELFLKERARKYMMAAFGTRPDYTEPRVIPYAREGRHIKVTVAGCCFIDDERGPVPGRVHLQGDDVGVRPDAGADSGHGRNRQPGRETREVGASRAGECAEVADFLIPEAATLGVRLDLRDLVEKSLPDYAPFKAGFSKVDWRDLVRRISWARLAS